MLFRIRPKRTRGFSLLELLVVTSIILVFSLVGFPAIKNLVERGRLLGAVRNSSVHLVMARQHAIKLGLPVVVRADFDADELVAFANVDRDAGYQFQPTPDSDKGLADFEIGRVTVPTGFDVYFWGPADKGAKGSDAVDGFTPAADGSSVAVFLSNGSVQDPGAFRFADDQGNFLELRIAVAATGRAEVLKYHPNPPWGGKAGFFPEGRHHASNQPLWEWY